MFKEKLEWLYSVHAASGSCNSRWLGGWKRSQHLV